MRKGIRSEWKWAVGVAFFAAVLFQWTACSRKNPIDPTTPLQEEIPILTSISASPSQIASGGAQSEIRVRLVNQNGEPLSGRIVSFVSTLGTVTTSDSTDASGWAQAILTSSSSAGQCQVTARYDRFSTLVVTILVISSSEAHMQLECGEASLLADGLDNSQVTVTVLADSAQPVVGAVVNLSTSFGSLSSLVITGSDGKAFATFTGWASERDTMATVTATHDTLSIASLVSFRGVSISVGAIPTAIQADGSSTSTIVALVKESTSHVAIADVSVRFGTNLGTIPGEAATETDGIAEVLLKSTTSPGTARVVAYYGNTLTDTVTVAFTSEQPGTYTVSEIQAVPAVLLANGIDQSTVTAKVVDNASIPVAGAVVAFSATHGRIASQAITDDDGLAAVLLTSEAGSEDVTSTVTAQIGPQGLSTPVTFEGLDFRVEANPNVVLADGQSTSAVTAVLKKTTSHVAVPQAIVNFGTDLGSIPYQEVTDGQGMARVVFTSSTTTGTAQIIASTGQTLSDTVLVALQESVPAYIQVSASPVSIPADGQSESVIRVTVSDASRNPVPDGTYVTFDIVEGTGTIEHQQPTSGGVAVNTLTSGTQPDTARVAVRVGVLSDTVEVVYTVGGVDRIEVSAEPDTIPADGITQSVIRARVLDAYNNPIEGVHVGFTASFGNLIQDVLTNSEGYAQTEFTSTSIGLAVITAEAGGISGLASVQVMPGSPYSITLSYNPHFMYVRDCGKQQTVSIYADVRDMKNNPVVNGTYVRFSIYAHPDDHDSLSTTEPQPTVGGIAQVSYTSGSKSGASRIQADVTDAEGVPITPRVMGISTEIVIYSGPPYMEDVNNALSTHLTLVSGRLNIWFGEDTTMVTALVGDKYNNPVQEGTAVYFTVSGGVITTKTYTDENGIARVMIIGGNPLPTIDRFYNYEGLRDPNLGTTIPGPIPDFEGSLVTNSEGGTDENDGVARVLAYTEGMDSLENSARVWDALNVIYSEHITHFYVAADRTTLSPGEYTAISIELWDRNGNPIVGGSTLTATYGPSAASAELSWTEKITGDPGSCYYTVFFYNTVKPSDPDAVARWSTVTIGVNSPNGISEYSVPIFLDIN